MRGQCGETNSWACCVCAWDFFFSSRKPVVPASMSSSLLLLPPSASPSRILSHHSPMA